MAKWISGNSGNPAGRPRKGAAITGRARSEIDKRRLVEKLGQIAAKEGEYDGVEIVQQLRAIQLLLAYGYGPPRVENSGGSQVVIKVEYVQRNQIAITGSAPESVESCSGEETVQHRLLRASLGVMGRDVSPRN